MSEERLLYILANIDDAFIEEAEAAYKAGRFPVRRSYGKYLAAAAALALLLLGAVRPTVLAEAAQAVVRWFEDHVSYRFRTETAEESVMRYTLQGLEEDYRLMDEEYLGVFGSETYESKDQKRSIHFLYGLSDGEIQIPGGDLEYKLILDADGTELHYTAPGAEGQEASLTWISEDGQTVFSISGRFSEEELLELRRHVVKLDGPMEVSKETDLTQGFEGILEGLTGEQAYAVWHPESEYPILLVAESGTYEIDGVNGSIFCQVYGLQDGVPKYLGQLVAGGTAYPLSWDDKYIYVEWQHSIGRYGISEETGDLVLSDGLSYIPAEEGYRIRRDAAVEETFDGNGEPNYISGGEWLDEESGEELFLKLQEESAGAEIIDFALYSRDGE